MMHTKNSRTTPAVNTHRMSGLALAAALALLGAGPAAAQAAGAAQAEYAQGRILVMPRAGLSDAGLSGILKEHGGKARRVGNSELRIVDLPPGQERKAVEGLLRNPHLKFVELDRLSKPSLASNDPYLGSQWHLSKIGALAAWDRAQGTGVTIAIIDTGVDSTHGDLASSLVPGWNFFNNSADTSDAYNHGTGVAGAAAATMNNALGVAGVSGQTRIMPIRISDASGYGSWSAMAQGLTYAADRGVRVANISYESANASSSVASAAQYMRNKGGLVFVSAGNTGAASTVAASSALISVGATGSTDAKASFSTYGPLVDLVAPGVGIYTTTRGGGYVSESGTSFSSPVAAGVAALVLSANPTLSASQVESILVSTAVDLGAAGRDDLYGHGRIDAAAAIQAALSTAGSGSVDSTAPTATITSPAASATISGIVAVNLSSTDNVSVTKVDLKVDGKVVATDLSAPYGFSWDSAVVSNGMHTLSVVAYDAAGNSGASALVSVNVANAVVADTLPPMVSISNPLGGSKVSGSVSVKVNASDNAGTAGIKLSLSIDGKQVATGSGGSMSYNWNTKKVSAGSHSIAVKATDAAGNASTTSVTVTR